MLFEELGKGGNLCDGGERLVVSCDGESGKLVLVVVVAAVMIEAVNVVLGEARLVCEEKGVKERKKKCVRFVEI